MRGAWTLAVLLAAAWSGLASGKAVAVDLAAPWPRDRLAPFMEASSGLLLATF